MKNYIRTFTGRKVEPLAPRVEDICIEDIAHALSLNCRFTGHTKFHYSVGFHSILCSWLVEGPENRMAALLHDASEAYMSDIASPLKHQDTFALYRVAEERLDRVIAERFNLVYPRVPAIKEVDHRMLATEIRDLLPTDEPLPYEPYQYIHIYPATQGDVEAAFLARYADLA